MHYKAQTILFWIGKGLLLGVIAYFGVIGITAPETFARMVPDWMGFASANTLVIIHGIVMTIAAVLVFFNIGKRWSYLLLLLTLVGVLLSVSGKILARDIAIFGAVLTLLASTYNKSA